MAYYGSIDDGQNGENKAVSPEKQNPEISRSQEYLKPKEAALIAGTTERSIREMILDGRLTKYTISGQPNGKLRVKRSELAAAMRVRNDKSEDTSLIAEQILSDLVDEQARRALRHSIFLQRQHGQRCERLLINGATISSRHTRKVRM